MAASLICAAVACQSSFEASSPNTNPGNTGGTTSAAPVTLSFLGDPPIHIAPRGKATIMVRVQPPAAYSVRFALLDAADGRLLGATLNRGEAVSSADGIVSVVLTAPDTPTTFRLRAQVDSAFVDTTISVDAVELATLNVIPDYAGTRPITEWIASVHAGVRCSDFTSTPPDGPFVIHALVGSPLHLVNVPAATPQAVVVRAGGMARGCATVDQPTPNEETDVRVSVIDAPVDLNLTVLDLVFGLGAQDAAFKAELVAGSTLVQAALRGSAANEPSALLDAMAATLSNGQRALFTQARDDAGWDNTLPAALGRNAATRLSDTLARWLHDGQGGLLSPRAFQARLAVNTANPDSPTLTPQRIAGGLPEVSALSASGTSWSVDPRDTLAFAGSLSWSKTGLVCAVSAPTATAETGAAELSSALAGLLSCEALGAHLASGRADSVLAWTSDCDAACNATLCQRALITLVQRACAASDKDRSTLTLVATGATEVGTQGQAMSLTGSWVGRLARSGGQAETGGTLRGSAPRDAL